MEQQTGRKTVVWAKQQVASSCENSPLHAFDVFKPELLFMQPHEYTAARAEAATEGSHRLRTFHTRNYTGHRRPRTGGTTARILRALSFRPYKSKKDELVETSDNADLLGVWYPARTSEWREPGQPECRDVNFLFTFESDGTGLVWKGEIPEQYKEGGFGGYLQLVSPGVWHGQARDSVRTFPCRVKLRLVDGEPEIKLSFGSDYSLRCYAKRAAAATSPKDTGTANSAGNSALASAVLDLEASSRLSTLSAYLEDLSQRSSSTPPTSKRMPSASTPSFFSRGTSTPPARSERKPSGVTPSKHGATSFSSCPNCTYRPHHLAAPWNGKGRFCCDACMSQAQGNHDAKCQRVPADGSMPIYAAAVVRH